MRRGWRIVAALAVSLASIASAPEQRVSDTAIMADALPRTLSEYGFFAGGAERPVSALIPYGLTAPLFSDYADKRRFIYLPPGGAMDSDSGGVVRFPVGSAIIKSFGYTQADGGYRTIETRVLLHRASGWVALPYIWRADGSDADLRLAGGRTPVTFTDPTGQSRTISYAVPNRNQCKTCHSANEQIVPIGPRIANMLIAPAVARTISGADWQRPRYPAVDDGAASLDHRARAYLASNCAHCHNPAGSASNSGLFLEYDRPLGIATGVFKRPVAAGRGSGGMDFAIRPGRPDQSYMVYRMRSTDPGIAMPELGRSMVHDEGVALIEQWIAAMPESAPPTAH